MAQQVSIDFGSVVDWDGFHSRFGEAFGFPEFYGRNMNAWIDCLSYVDDSNAGMSAVTIKPGESLDIIVSGVEAAFVACPEIVRSFFECTAFVNQRFITAGSLTRLRIILTNESKP